MHWLGKFRKMLYSTVYYDMILYVRQGKGNCKLNPRNWHDGSFGMQHCRMRGVCTV